MDELFFRERRRGKKINCDTHIMKGLLLKITKTRTTTTMCKGK